MESGIPEPDWADFDNAAKVPTTETSALQSYTNSARKEEPSNITNNSNIIPASLQSTNSNYSQDVFNAGQFLYKYVPKDSSGFQLEGRLYQLRSK